MTGGAGYVGSHAAKALRAAGYRVTIYDNLSAGHREAALGSPLIEGDIGDVDGVRRALRDTGASAVMHFAAWLNVGDSVRDPVGYYRNNVLGTLATLEAMQAESCRRFVFSSTCAVYGEPVETPIRETHPTAPINAYGQTKLAIEQALPHYERAWGLQSIRLRYFNAAGADPDGELGEDHNPEIHVIPRALRSGHRRRPVPDPRHRLPDAGRHLPAGLHSRHRPGVRARARAPPSRVGRRVRVLQSRHRASDVRA